ncbi:hypothetical protein MNBD_PLANCTO02-2867 [hydrothermal vent metagenome]|uniref:Uncharacterized protein n=1 Tax=hydrothermal vent metagenome TaxID=652676 RepID=A0A3B1DTZ9_9ZZZZ
MASEGTTDKFRLGFLTAIEVPSKGFVGGLLVTNHFGRPLEFQCTNPVKPNRTQEILYGPTLQTYVLSELIGRTLIEKVGVKPNLVLIDDIQMLDLKNHVPTPIAQINEKEEQSDLVFSLKVGRQFLRLDVAHLADKTKITKGTSAIPTDANLNEPFERVREALTETLGAGVTRAA